MTDSNSSRTEGDQFSEKFRNGLKIVFDSISKSIGFTIVHPQSDPGLHQIMVEAPWGCLASELGRTLGDYSMYETSNYETGSMEYINSWMDSCSDSELITAIEKFIDCIEVHMEANRSDFKDTIVQIIDGTIEEINQLFKSNNLGFEIYDRQIRKVDSKFLHSSVIRETVKLLTNNSFSGPLDEYQQAIEAYNKSNYKEVVRESSNAFESTLKTLLKLSNIAFDEKDTSSKLIKKLIDGGFLPASLQNYSNALSQIMASGLPTIANPIRHGQGIDKKNIDSNYALFALHLSGSYLTFLIQLYEQNKVRPHKP